MKKVIPIPKELTSFESVKRFEKEYFGFPDPPKILYPAHGIIPHDIKPIKMPRLTKKQKEALQSLNALHKDAEERLIAMMKSDFDIPLETVGGWMPIERDKDGYITPECVKAMEKAMPLLFYKGERGFALCDTSMCLFDIVGNDARVVLCGYKPHYTHFMHITRPDEQ